MGMKCGNDGFQCPVSESPAKFWGYLAYILRACDLRGRIFEEAKICSKSRAKSMTRIPADVCGVLILDKNLLPVVNKTDAGNFWGHLPYIYI